MASEGAADAAPNESEWSCDKCTFVNSVDDLTCTMCFQVRTSTRALPYTWQWLAQVDWITYDAPCNEQIEAAYQSGAASVNLTRGFCATKKGEYTILFGRKPAPHAKPLRRRSSGAQEGERAEGEDGGSSGSMFDAAPAAASPAAATVPAFTQRNNHSGMVRKVRRLANDDDRMFVVRPPSQVAQGERCSVCAEEWFPLPDDEEEGEGKPSAEESAAASQPPPAVASAAAVPSAAPAAAAAPQTCLKLHPTDQWPESGQAAVKLSNCAPGHIFHRDCIAAWIKLKDHCPYCAAKI